MIRALLADDEEHALNLLELLLKQTGEVEIAARCSNGLDALATINELRPDVAFLDIEMPGLNGVEVAERLGSDGTGTQIVFVTAYDRYAVSAFDQDAVDYLLKPLDMARLARTVSRVKREVAYERSNKAESEVAIAKAEGSKLHVRLLGEVEVLNDGGERLRWRTAKEKELFAYLALHQGNRVHRDVLLDELWPDEHYQKAKVYLHTCVSYLRRDLRQLGFQNAVLYDDEKYFLSHALDDSDYIRIQTIINIARMTPVKLSVGELEEAIALDQGVLLANEDYHWAEAEVRHVESAFEALRAEMANRYEQQGQFTQVIALARQLLRNSPYNEEAYRLMMRGYAGSGKHDEVLRVYDELIARLDELQIQPSELTKKFLDDLRVKK